MLKHDEYLWDAFCSQNYENHFFDAIFYVDGKELYAHREVLAHASYVFYKLFKKNRSKGNEPIQIDKYTYDEFKEFLYMCYSIDDLEDYDIDEDKLFAIIELTVIYKVDEIETVAGKAFALSGGFAAYVNDEELDDDDIKDIFEKIEFADKNSLECFKYSYFSNTYWSEFLDKYFTNLIEYDDFKNLEKSAVKVFVAFVVKHSDDAVKK